jgi:hypothetical protein
MSPSAAMKPRIGASKPVASTDEQLVAECLRGDQQAWAALVEKYRNLVYSVPMKYRMPPQDASDACGRG